MKIFIVESGGGEYDSTWNKVDGVFSTEELAKEYISSQETKRQAILDNFIELNWKELNILYVADIDAFNKYHIDRLIWSESREKVYYDITEAELDKPIV